MTWYGKHPSLSLTDDPDNPVWHWFLCNGPHGERFEWHKSSVAPRSIDTLREFIAKITEDGVVRPNTRNISIRMFYKVSF